MAKPTNPLIGADWTTTIHACEAVVAYLAGAFELRADISEQFPSFAEGESDFANRGVGLILRSVEGALRYAWSTAGQGVVDE